MRAALYFSEAISALVVEGVDLRLHACSLARFAARGSANAGMANTSVRRREEMSAVVRRFGLVRMARTTLMSRR